MSRLFTSGFELNSVTTGASGVEFGASTGTLGDPGFSIQAGTVINGAYSGKFRCSGGVDVGVIQRVIDTCAADRTYYARFNFRVHAYPTSTDGYAYVAYVINSSVVGFGVTLTTAGKLQLRITGAPRTQLGSDSSTTLSLDTNYCVEFSYVFNSGAVALRINLSSEISGTTTASLDLNQFWVGGDITSNLTAGEWYFDDLALNDDQGSYQNSWPGIGKVIMLRPNATGESASWARGGTDSGANWSQCNNIPPDDVPGHNNQIAFLLQAVALNMVVMTNS